MKIFKYPVEISNKPTILSLPMGSKVISCNQVANVLVVWAVIGEEAFYGEHFVYTVLTGQERSLPVDARFLGTVLFDLGAFIVHVFVKE